MTHAAAAECCISCNIVLALGDLCARARRRSHATNTARANPVTIRQLSTLGVIGVRAGDPARERRLDVDGSADVVSYPTPAMISLSGPRTLARRDRGHHRRPTRGAAAARTVASSAATMGASADQTQPSIPVEVNGRHGRWRRLPLPSSFKSALAEPALVTQKQGRWIGATPGTTATTTAGSCRHPGSRCAKQRGKCAACMWRCGMWACTSPCEHARRRSSP
jgi:hypothetical protein